MISQCGVLAYRDRDGGGFEILLITSRETKRWVIPKGNLMIGLSAHEAAAREAFEEAGVRGEVQSQPLGAYWYDKRLKDADAVPAKVEVFSMRVTAQEQNWPEKGQRDLCWFDTAAAADAVEEPELKALIRTFRPPERPPAPTA